MGSVAELDQAITYALAVADGYLSQLAALGLQPEGLRVLELGPGADLAPALLLAGRGARVTVADPYLTDFTPRHATLYTELAQHVETERPEHDARALRAALHAERHDGPLRTLRVPAERLGPTIGLAPASIDVCFSNAVLEHVTSPARTARRLFALTAPRGHGLHQVDFRDHRDFDRPLEHLTEPAHARALRRVRHRGAQGSSLRHPAYAAAFRRAGFEVLAFERNLDADAGYLDALVPRLHRTFRSVPRDVLAVLSGRFVVARPGEEAS